MNVVSTAIPVGPTPAPRILRLPDVMNKVGLGRSAIYKRMKEKTFPTSINLGGRAVGWLEHEADQWLNDQIAQSRTPDACLQQKGGR